MTDILKIHFPGAYTTVQDLGRYGYQAYGVPVSGCLDHYAHTAANLLAGNGEDAATLELTVLGPKCEVLHDCDIAMTGGDLQPLRNGAPLPQWKTVRVHRGDVLSFKGVKTGCRAYLAVNGGFDVPVVMGSRSTYPRAALGGLQGRPLKAGDILRKGTAPPVPERALPEELIPDYPRELTCRVVPGPQESLFENLADFYRATYEVTAQADRMGYRLKGMSLIFKPDAPKSIVSEAIVPGAIQVPADGNPIVLMAEQTVGGYAKIGVIITPDRWRLAQLRPGDKVRFERVDIETAQEIYRDTIAHLIYLKRRLHEP